LMELNEEKEGEEEGPPSDRSFEERLTRLIRPTFVAVLASAPSLIITYYPAWVLILFFAIELAVAYRSEIASLSLGLVFTVPAAIYQSQVFGLYYIFLNLIPLWTMIILSRAHEMGWVASILGYVGVQLGWSGLSSTLSFVPPALSGIIFTPRTGLLMGLVTVLCVIFLAYGQGATTYGFVNLPLRPPFEFMRFQRTVLESFGPMDFIQPVMGLANFDRFRFGDATSPLVSIFLSYPQFYVEVALWAVACYISGRIAHRWKGPYPLSAGLSASLAAVFAGYALTGGLAYITGELIAVGVFVPMALAACFAALGLERIPVTEGEGVSLASLFKRRHRAEKEEGEKGQTEGTTPTPEKTTELIQLEEAFSKSLGVTHQEMTGRKILFDYDPISEYEKVINDFCVEALANRGLVTVFTRKGSPVHNILSERAAIKFFCLTSQVSVPTDATRNEVWLPANDISLMLDALNKSLIANPKATTIWFVYDNLTELLFATGFERTYGFLRYATEILASPRISALFLFNSKAHDEKISVSIRGLFRNYIECGSEGLKLVRFPREQQ